VRVVRVPAGTEMVIDPTADTEHARDARALLHAAGVNGERAPEFVFEHEGAAIVLPRARAVSGVPRADTLLRFVSGTEAGPGRVEISRTWAGVYPPIAGAPKRGVAVVLPGLLGTPEPLLDALTRSLTIRGWTVVRLVAQPSRFTQRERLAVESDEPAETAGRRLAPIIADGLAENAYAVRAMLARIESRDPELADLPRVALGMSGGAITLPTAVALEPDRYAAAVLIAGGADLFTILDLSNYSDLIDGAGVSWDEPPDAARRDEVSAAYLRHAALDPFHTAGVLRGKPVLVYHASLDRAVPASSGELLWERLGRPERRVFEVGHELLFLGMATQVGPIVDWLDEAVPTGPPAAAPPADDPP
jgi:fermentation-respiration switch protein FrsA (DUF1100 family)